MSMTFLPKKDLWFSIHLLLASLTNVPSHAACTLWTGPVTVTSRAAGVKMPGICSPKPPWALKFAPQLSSQELHVSKCRRNFPPRLESCTFAPVSTQTSCKNPLTRWHFLEAMKTELHWLTDFGWMYSAFPLKVSIFLWQIPPQSSRAVCKKFPPFPRIFEGRSWLRFFQHNTVTSGF